jgi:hypothetical protein
VFALDGRILAWSLLVQNGVFPSIQDMTSQSLTRDAADETGRHCERSEAIHSTAEQKNGLLRRKRSSQ